MARGRAPKSAKKHDFGTRESTKNPDFVHEGEHQKARSRARFFARGKAIHEREHQKARFLARRRAPKARSRARFLAQGRAPKTTILCTRESTKKHDLEHDFLHEGKQYTKESTKKHDFWHEGEHQKARSRARFFARGKAIHEGEHQKPRFCARGRAPKSGI